MENRTLAGCGNLEGCGKQEGLQSEGQDPGHLTHTRNMGDVQRVRRGTNSFGHLRTVTRHSSETKKPGLHWPVEQQVSHAVSL